VAAGISAPFIPLYFYYQVSVSVHFCLTTDSLFFFRIRSKLLILNFYKGQPK